MHKNKKLLDNSLFLQSSGFMYNHFFKCSTKPKNTMKYSENICPTQLLLILWLIVFCKMVLYSDKATGVFFFKVRCMTDLVFSMV